MSNKRDVDRGVFTERCYCNSKYVNTSAFENLIHGVKPLPEVTFCTSVIKRGSHMSAHFYLIYSTDLRKKIM